MLKGQKALFGLRATIIIKLKAVFVILDAGRVLVAPILETN